MFNKKEKQKVHRMMVERVANNRKIC